MAETPEELNNQEPELSLDELEAVAGGVETIDWQKNGCMATVEKDSDCWGVDGGCTAIHYKYTGVSEGDRCRVRLTHPCEYEKVSEEVRPIYNNGKHATVTTYKCIYCGRKKELYVV